VAAAEPEHEGRPPEADFEDAGERHRPRMTAVMREDERVTPLELFFDLVFVLALTQCTTLIGAHGGWEGLLQGLLVLGVLWWSWVGYAWLTSVVNPEEGLVRLAMFVAMAAFLVAALSVPGVFGANALAFALAYTIVRVAHIALFMLASREDAGLRHSVLGLAISTAIGAGLLIVASFADGALQLSIWGVALALDVGGPLVTGIAGWRIVPGHFAERHGAVVIIALGESIVAIGVGAHERIDAGIVAAAVLGLVAAACLWWAYFDVTAIVGRRVLEQAEPGAEQNRIARDAYSYLHFPMVAGIALLALGVKQTVGDADAHLALVPAFCLTGGAAMFLLAQFAFRLRMRHTFGIRRLLAALALLALLPLHSELSALAMLGAVTAVLVAMISYEALRYAEAREHVRHRVLDA
jgi:low temperature requirement protein LtrA